VENGMQVCNLSLGTTNRDFFARLHELADAAWFRNLVLVAAANNVSRRSFPSVYASVISVASHDAGDPEVFYCNPAPPAEFGAQGVNVRVPWVGGGWLRMTGNSLAAPHVTGMVARLLAKHPDLTPAQVKTVLRELADNAGEVVTR
jgi:subtilisin